MRKRYFEKEVMKARERFNSVFGQQEVCSLKARQAAIMSICWLGLLCEKITAAGDSREVKEDIEDFAKTKNVLTKFFDSCERFNAVEEQQEGVSNGKVIQIRYQEG